MKSNARNMITQYKSLSYELVDTDIPSSYKMIRNSRRNPVIYISLEGISFKPYWVP